MYNPKSVYSFTDENGNIVYSNGDNGYIRDAYENGIGLSFDDNGDWFTRPYIESANGKITAIIPSWFKATPEYETWTKTYVPQIKTRTIDSSFAKSVQDTLSSLADMGALRQSLRTEAKNYGLDKLEDQDAYADAVASIALEGNKDAKEKAQLNFSHFLEATDASATEIAREYKKLSKEDLSAHMSNIYDVLNKSSNGTFNGSKDVVFEAAVLSRLLNYIDENHSQYGENDEFKGLLEPSQWQRFQAAVAADMANITYNSIFGLPTRIIDKVAEWFGGDFIPNTYEAYLSDLARRPMTGGNLGNLNQQGAGSKNTEGDISWGNFIGSVEIIGATIGMTMAGQAWVQGKLMAAAPGTIWGTLSTILDKGGFITNTLITDFVMNDLPMDIFMLISDAGQYGWDKAFYDPENPQSLWGVPFLTIKDGSITNEYGVPNLTGFGPQVPGGFLFNVIGDLTLDFAPKIIATTLGQIDNATGGYMGRAKQKVKDASSIANMKLVNTIEKVPILGTSIKKTVNFFTNTSDANMVRSAKQTAIATKDVDWYVRAQQVITQQNHGGYEAVMPRFKKILADTGVSKFIDYFTKNKNEFGGIKKRTASVVDIDNGEYKVRPRTISDKLPEKVRDGLLDIQRLAELKGEDAATGGLVSSAERQVEIAELEARVENLPQVIKDFATALHEANVEVNKMIEDLGLRPEGVTEKWMEDPRFEYYMVRQTLSAEPSPNGRTGNQAEPNILNKSRTGNYNRDAQIDPTIALAMKVEAIGKAWAANERSKFVAAMAEASNNIIAGAPGMKAARDLTEVKSEIKSAQVLRDTLEYDTVLSKFNANADTVNSAFRHINELLNLPDAINAKSVYVQSIDPDVKNFRLDFNSGKISFAEGLDKIGLGDSDLADVMHNTYSYKPKVAEYTFAKEIGEAESDLNVIKTISQKGLAVSYSIGGEGAEYSPTVKAILEKYGFDTSELHTPSKVMDKINDKITKLKEVDEGKTAEGFNGAGVTGDGIPYMFDVKDNEVVSIRKAQTNKELADSVTGLSGAYSITEDTVKQMGEQNVYAVNRSLIFYRENLPEIAEKTIFKIAHYDDSGVYGWCKIIPDKLTVGKDGKLVVPEWEVFVSHEFYDKGKEAHTLESVRGDVQAGYHPKNSADLSNTFTHENGHSVMGRLALLEMNQLISEGKLSVSEYDASIKFYEYRNKMQEEILYNAMKKNGMTGEDGNHQKLEAARHTVSRYAWDSSNYATKNSETIAEALVDYAFNGQNASAFTIAVVNEIQERLLKFSTAPSPREALEGNSLKAPKGLLDGEGYAFPANVKTQKQQAKWLDQWRQKNPYIKGPYTEEKYRQANTWDSFFQKEINARDSKMKTSAPDALVKKNAEFLDNLNKNAVKQVLAEIKKASVEGVDEDLAMLVLSRNYDDSTDAFNRYIIKQVDTAAEAVAAKMDGGLTEENLTKAKVTLWADINIKKSTVNLVSSLVPGTNITDVRRNVEVLFKTQADGYAAVDALPIDVKDLIAEKKKLQSEIASSNRYAKQIGAQVDKANAGKYSGEVSQVIRYMDNGQEVYVVVNDPVITSVLERPNNYKEHGQVAELWKMTAKFVAQSYRLGTTGINLPNLVKNFLRDPLQATITTEFNPLTIQLDPRWFYRTLRGYGLSDATIDTVLNQIKTRASSSTLSAEIRGLGFMTPGSASYTNKIQQMSNALEKTFDIKVIKKAQMPLEAWEGFMRTQIGEQAFVRHLKRTGDVDASLGRALLETSNATTDFSHAVAGLRNITSTVPYLSSAINGARSFGVLFTIDPVGMIGRISAGFMMPVMAITAWNLSDEERRKAYMRLPEWYKSKHIVLISPDGKSKFSLPLPDEVSNYATLSRNLIEYTNDVSPYTINMILARGVFGMLPADIDGFFAEDGSIDWGRGFQQMIAGLSPQLVTAIWEQVSKRDTYTGQSYENLDALNQIILFGSNIFGSTWKQVANDIGMMVGQPNAIKIGKSTAETLARDLFGMGFNESTNQFMAMIGNPSKAVEYDESGNVVKGETAATGLFKESEELKSWVDKKNTERATAKDDEEIEKIDKEINDRVNAFVEKVGNLTNRYMQLYSVTGGLEDWQKNKIIQILTLGDAWSSNSSTSYESEEAQQAYLNERSLAAKRYMQAGLPSEPSLADLGDGSSISLQAALNSFYGAPKQAATDFRNAVEKAGIKDIRDRFYDVIDQIYDAAEEQGKDPDYDLIERIQARFLQAIDAVLVPIISQYGINVLNNADFVNAVKKQVNGMIPSDDWKRSAKNAKKYLSSKEFPTATVDVKKWLIKRYTSNISDRGLGSDQEVIDRIQDIKDTIDRGETNAARGKISDLKKGIGDADYYISENDLQTLYDLNNMLK